MPYKLGELPSIYASMDELADFLELKCIVSESGIYSIQEAASAMGIVTDESSDDRIEEELPYYDVLSVIDDRRIQTGGKYPFITDQYSLTIIQPTDDETIKDVYTFLLLATRNNMSGKTRTVTDADGNQLDGAKLFEQLSAAILKSYFGENCNSFVFGTGDDVNKSFQKKLENLLAELKEPNTQIDPPPGNANDQKDDGLDVVVHIPFDDKRNGQFMAFGQCKTGDHWETSIRQLSPSNFSKDYFHHPLLFTPITVHIVSEAFVGDWYHKTGDVLFFDRSRLMRYMPKQLDEGLLSKIRIWNNGIINNM